MASIKEKISALPSLRLVVDAYGLMAKKSLGQNFLLDENVTDKIVRLSLAEQGLQGFENANVLEVGPGPGGLTRAVLKNNPDKLTVIEMDDRCINIMHDIVEKVGDKLQVVSGDALNYDYSSLENGTHIVSNLPYNISVPLLTGWLYGIEKFSSLTLMFQKEVADRIMSEPNCKAYGRLSVLAQLQCRIDRLMDLNPNCFVPAPKIWSSVLCFRPLEKVLTREQINKVETLTALAFGNRRKMIRQSLKQIQGLEEKCERLEIETTLRAENLTPQQYLALAELM